MNMHEMIDFKDECNRSLRRRRITRRVATTSVATACLVVGAALGVFLASVGNLAVGAVITLSVLAGLWGGNYLIARH
jgi:uncharacterized protein YneF (UPF0154 family)